jgi:hypothetical protein
MPERVELMATDSLPMVPRTARALFAVGFAFAFCLASAGKAEETAIWTERSSGDLTTLSYGPLSLTTNPLFMLSCFSDMNIVVLDVHKEIAGAKRGDALAIELSSAKTQVPIKAEVDLNEETGTSYAEASDIDVKPILQALQDAGPLTLKLGAASLTLSDQGRADAVAKFSESCKLDD